jgi:TPR repeat protein
MTDHISRRCAILLLTAVATVANAIDAPKPAPPPPPAPEPPRAHVTPTNETELYSKLQRVSQRRNLRGLGVKEEAIQALGRAEPDAAVATLSGLAASGDLNANIALVRIQHWCGRATSFRPGDPLVQVAKLGPLSEERAARVAGVLIAEIEFMKKAGPACGRAQFDYQGIEGRLRAAASAGNPASATELAKFTRDPAKRQAFLQAAIDKGYQPAMYELAKTHLFAVQRGETTENVSSIRLLLKQAGRTVSQAKLDLANCMAVGCDGHPADVLQAHAFGIDAARDGEPNAFLSMVRMPWGGRLNRMQMLGWQYFGNRLNDSGCMGDSYVPNTGMFAQTIGLLEKGADAKFLEDARAYSETLWRDNGVRAMKEQGCDEDVSKR